MKNIFIYTYSIEKKTLKKMARRKHYTKMKENVSPKSAAFELSNTAASGLSNAAFELTNLKRLHKSQLINLLLQQNAKIKQLEQQTINDNNKKPIPKPRKNVKQMVQDYEDNIIPPPVEFSDDCKPIPKPRKNVKQMVQDYEDNIIQPPSEFRDDYKPIPKPRTKKPVCFFLTSNIVCFFFLNNFLSIFIYIIFI